MLYDHVDLRVASLEKSRRLYDALLPAMGYSHVNSDDESAGYHRPEENGAEPFIWVVEERDHRPNATRIALAAGNRGEVDRLAAIASAHGAREFEPPQLVPEYGANYYATFFEDAEGNKLEICCRRAPL
jgi:catechol 2,3-dioxygenase-like lactoylglutathione lyase family enzyme